MKSKVLARDLENISKRVCFQEFDNSTVLVTGATGLIGSLLVKTLIVKFLISLMLSKA